MAAIFQI